MEKKYYAGLDIGGTKCACIIGSDDGEKLEILRREAIPTDKTVSAETMLSRLDEILAPLLAQYPVESIGISCGGPLDSVGGIIQSPPNLPGWDDVHICEYYSSRHNLPVRLQNDANACGLAEWMYGAGRGTRSMVFCTMGTGFGAGLVLDGKLYAGVTDCAGEIGHIRLTDEGPVGYGKRGTVEGYCSGGGIAQVGRSAAMELLQVGKKCGFCSSIAELDGITAKSIGIAAENGDATAIEVYRYVGHMLGRAMSLVIDLINPEMIVIGSVFVRSEEFIRGEMQHVIDAECLASSARACRIVPAKLGEALGDFAAISVAAMK
ncbi:MAG: ROK family protein [Eubacteriales bacterium]